MKIKTFLKRHWLIAVIITGLILLIFNFLKYNEQFDIRLDYSNRLCTFLQEEDEKNIDSFCNSILMESRFKNDLYSDLMCQKFARDGVTEDIKQQCKNILATANEPKTDFYVMFTNMIIYLGNIIDPFSFLFIAIPTLIGICKFLKRKYIINTTTRESYRDFLIHFFKKAYRYVWVLPFFALLMIGISILSTTFDHSYSLSHSNYTLWQLSTIQNRYLFIIGYVSNIILYSCFFINLCLIVVRKYHNTFVAIIISFLSYIGIELFFEIVVKTFISLVFHNDIGNVLNIMNMWNYSDAWGLFPLLTFSITMCLLSFIGVYFAYRDKEKFIIACEKNN